MGVALRLRLQRWHAPWRFAGDHMRSGRVFTVRMWSAVWLRPVHPASCSRQVGWALMMVSRNFRHLRALIRLGWRSLMGAPVDGRPGVALDVLGLAEVVVADGAAVAPGRGVSAMPVCCECRPLALLQFR